MPTPRIISLIPSATEILDSLGFGDYLVGRSHECDYPATVTALPVCTEPAFDPEGSSREVHDRVTELLQSALGVYRVDIDLLQELQPTHIVTQAQCEVCAVSLADVEAAVAEITGTQPQVISLEPARLTEVWEDFYRVAIALTDPETGTARAQATLLPLQQRLDQVATLILARERPRVACIEWPDPLMAAGNWVPELVEMAGGQPLFGAAGQHSPWLTWSSLVEANPDRIVLMPCGYDLEKTVAESQGLKQHPQWSQLHAVQTQQVFATDGNQYFNRPGPRLVDSAEILAEICHPDAVDRSYRGKGWRPFS